MSFKIEGLKEAQKKLKDLSDKANKLDGQSVPLSDVLTDAFVSKNSSFVSFDKLIEASGFKVESQADFEAIPDKKWDEFILINTSFENWQGMINAAGVIYAKNQLGF